MNVHNGIEPSRRDDLESCIYVILNMLYGELEWFNAQNNTTMKMLKGNIKKMPQFIQSMLKYVRGLSFDEKPNYDSLIYILVSTYETNGFINDGKFEWS